jgi:hypothetical protein
LGWSAVSQGLLGKRTSINLELHDHCAILVVSLRPTKKIELSTYSDSIASSGKRRTPKPHPFIHRETS